MAGQFLAFHERVQSIGSVDVTQVGHFWQPCVLICLGWRPLASESLHNALRFIPARSWAVAYSHRYCGNPARLVQIFFLQLQVLRCLQSFCNKLNVLWRHDCAIGVGMR